MTDTRFAGLIETEAPDAGDGRSGAFEGQRGTAGLLPRGNPLRPDEVSLT